ncbi:MAG: HIRAN domain-containing protein [bacterium]|nr:HIRAN domain-containing protein [bacterium]
MSKFSIITKVVGIQYNEGKSSIGHLNPGDTINLVREPKNTADPNAIAVKDLGGNKLGYISREWAARLAPKIDAGSKVNTTVKNITGSYEIGFGLDITIEVED